MCSFLDEIEKHKDAFYRFVHRMLWDDSQADDVFSDAILTAWENYHRYKPGSNFRAWMFRILANKCFTANRYTGRWCHSLENYPEEDDKEDKTYVVPRVFQSKPDEVIELCSEEVYKAFQKLNPIQRTCILLKDVEDFSYKEISEILEIPEATVMTNLARGRKKLRKLLYSYAREHGLTGASESKEKSFATLDNTKPKVAAIESIRP